MNTVLSVLAILLALGAWGFVWWRTRPRDDTEVVQERDAKKWLRDELDELHNKAKTLLRAHNRTVRRLDALEAREVPDVSGLRERVSTLEEEVSQLDRETVIAFKRATSALGNSEQAIVGMWHTWSTCPATLEAEPEADYGEGGCVVYHHAGDTEWEEVVEAARVEYHDVAHSPELRLLAVHFHDPESAPETLAGAERIHTRRRLNRTRVGASHHVGDHTDWRNE